MKQTIVLGLLLLLSSGVLANGRRVTFTVNISRPMDAKPSEFVVAQSLLSQAYGLTTTSDVDHALRAGTLNLIATYNTSNGKESFYATLAGCLGGHRYLDWHLLRQSFLW